MSAHLVRTVDGYHWHSDFFFIILVVISCLDGILSFGHPQQQELWIVLLLGLVWPEAEESGLL